MMTCEKLKRLAEMEVEVILKETQTEPRQTGWLTGRVRTVILAEVQLADDRTTEVEYDDIEDQKIS